jgi:hypothetical protein
LEQPATARTLGKSFPFAVHSSIDGAGRRNANDNDDLMTVVDEQNSQNFSIPAIITDVNA